MKQVDTFNAKLEALKAARAEQAALFPEANKVEKTHGIGSDEATAFEDAYSDPALDAVLAAETALSEHPAKTVQELLLKAAALLLDGSHDEIPETIGREAQDLLEQSQNAPKALGLTEGAFA